VSSDGGFSETAPVGMGGQTVMMTIDTGAMFGVITKSTADMLIASGAVAEAEGGTATLADGRTVPERRVLIKPISLGSQTVNNVLTGGVGRPTACRCSAWACSSSSDVSRSTRPQIT
jgi:predicted aspartyl protease